MPAVPEKFDGNSSALCPLYVEQILADVEGHSAEAVTDAGDDTAEAGADVPAEAVAGPRETPEP
jgi:hypothetical protein